LFQEIVQSGVQEYMPAFLHCAVDRMIMFAEAGMIDGF